MRLPFLAAFVLLVPVAVAQLGSDPVTVTLQPPNAPVRPLQGAIEIVGTVEASCPPTVAMRDATVTYRLVRSPAWANVVVSPATDSFGFDDCESGVVTREVTLTVTASDQAPAFMPEMIALEATVTAPQGEPAVGEGTVPVMAAFFSIIDAQTPETRLVANASGAGTFLPRFTNFGNGNTLLAFTLEAAEGVDVLLPSPIPLQSKQAGGTATAASAPMGATLKAGAPRGTFTVRYEAAYALDPAIRGDSGTLSFELLRGVDDPASAIASDLPGEASRALPAPSLPLGALAVLAAALLARRR